MWGDWVKKLMRKINLYLGQMFWTQMHTKVKAECSSFWCYHPNMFVPKQNRACCRCRAQIGIRKSAPMELSIRFRRCTDFLARLTCIVRCFCAKVFQLRSCRAKISNKTCRNFLKGFSLWKLSKSSLKASFEKAHLVSWAFEILKKIPLISEAYDCIVCCFLVFFGQSVRGFSRSVNKMWKR